MVAKGVADPQELLPQDKRRLQGAPHAWVTLVEFGDFECEHCRAAHPIVKQLQSAFGSDLRFAYRHFPIKQVHPHAELAAEAAEAAAQQGRFWEMHELLFENQNALERDQLISYAELIGLDLERFTRELDTHVYHTTVRADFVLGMRSGVDSTPAFFINGERYIGPQNFESMKEAIQDAFDQETLRRAI